MQLWTEKYRPSDLSSVISHDDITALLSKSLQSRNLPHLLFYGPPGTGKTSTILAVARELYGEHMKERVMELNASDERGIKIVRTKIKEFAAVQVSTHNGALPPYKLIILDEADSMTDAAQAALRRTMEVYSKNTRFCLICNYISRIIDPISSRCAKFRFKPLGEDLVTSALLDIHMKEGGSIDDEERLRKVARISGGDMRKAITYVQSIHRFYGGEISDDNINEVAATVPDKILVDLGETIRSGSWDAVEKWLRECYIAEGFSAGLLLNALHKLLFVGIEGIKFPSFTNDQIALAGLELAKRDEIPGDEYLQLLDLLGQLLRIHQGVQVIS